MWYEYYKMGERFIGEFLFFLSRNSNQIYQVGFKDRNKLIRFLFPEFGFNQKKPSVPKITTIERKQFFPIIEYFQNKLPEFNLGHFKI